MLENPEKTNRYQQYQELGGIIDEKEYKNALARARTSLTAPEDALIKQAENIARSASIELHNTKDAIDPITMLYGVLRADTKPEGAEYHHSQMSDQRLFAEALRMSGNSDALNKLVEKYHKAGIYCPLCSKVVTSGEECR